MLHYSLVDRRAHPSPGSIRPSCAVLPEISSVHPSLGARCSTGLLCPPPSESRLALPMALSAHLGLLRSCPAGPGCAGVYGPHPALSFTAALRPLAAPPSHLLPSPPSGIPFRSWTSSMRPSFVSPAALLPCCLSTANQLQMHSEPAVQNANIIMSCPAPVPPHLYRRLWLVNPSFSTSFVDSDGPRWKLRSS